MGYNTTFTITITASPVERQRELAQQICRLACISGSDEHKALEDYDYTAVLTFDAKWYEWKRDLQGAWYDIEFKDIRHGLQLKDDESVIVSGAGAGDNDMWRAFTSKRKFSVESCRLVIWTKKRLGKCGNIDSDDICSGCLSCADRKAIY